MPSPAERGGIARVEETPGEAPAPAPGARRGAAGGVPLLSLVPIALVLVASATVLVLSQDLDPADAAYPRVLAVILLALGLWNLLSDVLERRRAAAAERSPSAEALHESATAVAAAEGDEYGAMRGRRIAAFAALGAVSAWLMTPLGFFPASGLLLAGGLVIMGVRNPIKIVAYVAVMLGGGYLLFVELLKVALPLGQGF